MRTPCVILLISVIVLGTAVPAFSADRDATAFTSIRNYLNATGLNARWQDGDLMRIDSAELRAAYPNRQFYFTFKAAPLPPGAVLPDLIARYKAQVAEYQKHSLRLTFALDASQNVVPVEKADDFNLGLMPVKSDADAKIAAAAILSLIGDDQVHPEAIGANEVTVTRTNSGWTCQVSRTRGFDGAVVLDSRGKVVGAKKVLNYVPPMPP